MAFNLPIGATTDSISRLSLDGITYDFRTRYNELSGCWYLYVGYTGEESVAKIKLVVGWELLSPYKSINGVPQGDLWVVDVDTTTGRPSRDDTGQGKQFQLVYFTEGEDLTNVSGE